MSRLGITSGLLLSVALLGTSTAQTPRSVPAPPPPGQVSTPLLEGPATDLEPIPPENGAGRSEPAREVDSAAVAHDALQTPEERQTKGRVYAPKQPPPAVSERPAGRRPQPGSEWVSGYWEWDPARSEYFWMAGVWQVPPAGSIWISNRWLRNESGWYRRPGFWSRRRGSVAVETMLTDDGQAVWRKTGPPVDHPADIAAAAPGPEYFFVPGYYAPAGDQVQWKPGFWARSQPGWDWIPARWVRRSSGWEFRAGHWVEERGGDLAIPRTAGRRDDRPQDLDQPDTGRDGDTEGDPIADAEAGGRIRRRVVVVPPRSMPYYVIRPPGMYPYGQAGVIVPGVVPGFVRDILDQVLP